MSPDPSSPSLPFSPGILPTACLLCLLNLTRPWKTAFTNVQLTNYYYACLNYPVKSTLTKAISRGYLKRWQGITSQQTCHHISVSTESKMGHMDQQCQGVQSTQPTPTTVPLRDPDIFKDPMEDVPQEPHNTHTHFIFMVIYKINGNLFTDQMGQFPITSNRGHAYVVVFYIFDANAI
jgi:hypothetical protein